MEGFETVRQIETGQNTVAATAEKSETTLAQEALCKVRTHVGSRVGGWEAIPTLRLRLSSIARPTVIVEVLRWCGGISKRLCLGDSYSRAHQRGLRVSILLSSESSLAQRIYNSLRNVKAKDWGGRERPWYWFPPCLESLIKFLANIPVDQCVNVHKSIVEIASEVDCVGSSHILDD